ncbi:tyrosine-type recombinase/integrase [Stieleria varia]|uniref:Site-specific tyrosine recombinase XerC n=1 Tax=Stieleria varia TaxID=2528005 RepID=A0A5C6AH07_9BACT|nr:site-specific integrase [Stieleria varia]TWT98588.1 site-specific tyrosine recombinase XerC [Stieleria varia]
MHYRQPKYQKHVSGKARVYLQGKDRWLGKYDSPESYAKYNYLVGLDMAGLVIDEELNKASLPPSPPEGFTVKVVCAEFLKYAKNHYVKHNPLTSRIEQTNEFDAMVRVVNTVVQLFGDTFARDFGPRRLEEVRDHYIANSNKSRQTINKDIGRIKTIFKWGAGKELVPIEVHQAHTCVTQLKKNKTPGVHDAPKIGAVDDDVLIATFLELPPVVAAMVDFQLLTGARPGEVVAIRPSLVDRSREVWEYRVEGDKMEGKFGKDQGDRVVMIGLRAQQTLQRYMDRPSDQFCFSPAENAKLVRDIRTRKQLGLPPDAPLPEPKRQNRKKANPRRPPKDFYTTGSYGQAIQRVAERVFPFPDGLTPEEKEAWKRRHHWRPNRLRHKAATSIRAQFDTDTARVLLGHKEASTTSIYAEQDLVRARQAALAAG